MSDDRTFLMKRISEYAEYTDADERAHNDERVRAFTGERLAAARVKVGGELDEATAKKLDAAIVECQFADMKYVRILEDAHLDDAAIAAIETGDRCLVEAGELAVDASAAKVPALLDQIERAFETRRAAVEAKAAVPASD
jgi:hypothetical protein